MIFRKIQQAVLITMLLMPGLSSVILAQEPLVATFFGNGQPGFVNGSVDSARFNHPFGLSKGYMGQLFIADADNHCIRVINTLGVAETYAGTGLAGYQDGPASVARFNSPSDIWADPDSNIVYVCDFQNQRIRKIADGIVTTLAGSGQAGYLDGQGTSAKFNYPRGICRDAQGNLYIGDSWNHRIRKITPSGNVTTYAGGGAAIGVGSVGAWVDAQGTDARFYTPAGLAIDNAGNIYVADAYNHRIRKIDTQQQVSTFAGSGPVGVGQGGFADGPPLAARFNTPTEITFFETFCPGNAPAFFIADTYNNRIRMTREDLGPWNVTTYAGSGIPGYQDGLADSARFNYPRAITGWFGDATCVIFIADYNNHSIRYIQDHYTGIRTVSSVNGFLIFPNPACDEVQLNIDPTTHTPERFIIRDQLGNIVMAWLLNNSTIKNSFNLSHLPPGLYVATLYFSDGQPSTTKLLKF
jgi:hypothetical protein